MIEDHEKNLIGVKYIRSGKRKDLCTVIDKLKTFNSKGELVQIRYVSEHDFMGQKVIDRDVVLFTIMRGTI